MDYYLNELSLCPVENVSDAHRVMRQFISCCACLRHLGMNAIRLNSSLNDFELTENYFVYQWRTDSNSTHNTVVLNVVIIKEDIKASLIFMAQKPKMLQKIIVTIFMLNKSDNG